MHRACKITSRFLRRFWRGLREWCGDSAYERYQRSMSAKHGAPRIPTAEEFYVERLDRHYSRPNRCC